MSSELMARLVNANYMICVNKYDLDGKLQIDLLLNYVFFSVIIGRIPVHHSYR